MTDVHSPKNTMPRIDAIWAFLSVDPEDGNEGVLAGPFGPGDAIVPLIAADEARLVYLWPLARYIARKSGLRCRLVKFHLREVIEEFTS